MPTIHDMDELFTKFGLSEKESNCYRFLLEQGSQTAAMLGKHIGETRTNTYMILDRLEKAKLVNIDESRAIRHYEAADPAILQKNIVERQQELKQTQRALAQTLPELRSLYNLNRLKPGVVYLEGLKGLEIMLDDMARSQEEALIIPSGDSPKIAEAWAVLQKGVNKRAKLGAKSKIIFPEAIRHEIEFKRLKKQGMTIRFWGSKEYPGEIVVYGDKCAFTTYSPSIVSTILTNDVIAQTLREIFEDIWQQSSP